MKRALLYGALVALAIIILGVTGVAGWLLATPEGGRRLLETAASMAGARLEIGRMEGRLLDGLRLQDTTLRASEMTITAGLLILDWNPLPLLIGDLSVEKLHARRVDIVDNRPESEEPTDLSWPVISGPLARVNGRVGDLDITGFTYEKSREKPFSLNRVSCRADLRAGRLAVTRLIIGAPEGVASGAAGVSFREPRLNLFATVKPSSPAAGFERFLVHAALRPGRGDEQAAGNIHAVAAGKERKVELSSGAALTRTSISFRNLALSEAGRQGRITGKGTISFAGPKPELLISLGLEKLDLSREAPTLPPLTGALGLKGNADAYKGDFHLAVAGKGWRSADLRGKISGDNSKVDVTLDRGALLKGTLSGALRAAWQEGLSLTASLRARKLDPSRITPDWKGEVNLDAQASLRNAEGAPLSARLEARLLESRLRGRALSGVLAAHAAGNDVILDRLFLQGKGFDLRAAGNLASNIVADIRIDDMSGLVPGASGALLANGKIRRREGRFGGDLAGRASSLKMAGISAGSANFKAAVSESRGQALAMSLQGRDLGYQGYSVREARLNIKGALGRHVISLDASSPPVTLKTVLEGAWRDSGWRGMITTFSGNDGAGPFTLESPAVLRVSGREMDVSSLALTGAGAERLELDGKIVFRSRDVNLSARWRQLNLARLARFEEKEMIEGVTSGDLSVTSPPGRRVVISGNIDLAGTAEAGQHRVEVPSATVRIETTGGEIRAILELNTARDGRLTASCDAPAPSSLSLPERIGFQASLEGSDFRAIRPWLPAGLSLEGGISARAEGEWGPSGGIRLSGTANVGKGIIAGQGKRGELRANIRSAVLTWDWSGQALDGAVNLDLAETGRLEGKFTLPVPARLPAAIEPDGPVSMTLNGNVRENGILSALFPGMIQESRGELEIKARAGGTWRTPSYGGKFLLSRAGVYLPRAGVRFRDVQVSTELINDTIRVQSFSARSGEGALNGSALIRLKEWKLESYSGKINGDRFQFMNLPELQLLGSPNLDFSGTMEAITVRGEMGIPELLARDSRAPAPVRPSRDVVVVDAPAKPARSFPLAVDARVRVKFGDKVFVKAAGIDARLGGAVDLTMRGPDDIRGKGEVRVEKGSFRAYGVNLQITKGRLVFPGGPVSRPNLDILALRAVGEVKAGVMVGGTLQNPAIRLYSEPGMAESDIMGYIVLGHPLSGDKGQANAVMGAAGLLLSAGESAVLREQITERFGIDSFGVEQDKTDATRSLVTVGKYLTPNLFLSYGRSLFSPAQLLRARYTFSERWEIETWTGTESGVDLFYKINFN
jgi:translocation and assembly module TamB